MRTRTYPPTRTVEQFDEYHATRVVPGHSLKYAAALQAAQGGAAQVLIRVETRTGHGGGKPTALVMAEQANVWAFVGAALGM